jgi:predicted HTH transcriptional regulator
MSNRQKVREYFEKMKVGTSAQAAKSLGIPAQTAYANLRDLYEQGWLKKVLGCPGMYEYHQLKDFEYGRSVKMQEMLWRAMRNSKTFTAWSIAMLSGASMPYTKEYIAFAMKKGLVSKTGKKGHQAIYGVKSEPGIDTPVMRSAASTKELHRQVIIDLGWDLMRALRDGDMEKAREINKMLGCEQNHPF